MDGPFLIGDFVETEDGISEEVTTVGDLLGWLDGDFKQSFGQVVVVSVGSQIPSPQYKRGTGDNVDEEIMLIGETVVEGKGDFKQSARQLIIDSVGSHIPSPQYR